MALAQIPGLSAYTSPSGYVNEGKLPLPQDFNKSLHVGKWVKKGPAVDIAKQSEPIPSEGVVAEGWQVWRDSKKQYCQRTLSTGIYILMFRPKVLQTAINKCYGNASRRRMVQEATGKTVAGAPVQDTGMFPQDVLNKIPGMKAEQPFEESVPFNSLEPDDVNQPLTASVTTDVAILQTRKQQTIQSEQE